VSFITLLCAVLGIFPAEQPPKVSIMRAVQEWATALELLDERERRYILARPEDFWADFRLVLRRSSDLADAPFEHEAHRFPPLDEVNQAMSFNRAHRHYLTQRQLLDPLRYKEWQNAIIETDKLYQIWDKVRDARCDYFYVSVRRSALRQLKDMIGTDNYYNGCLPLPVPVWRFTELR